MVGVPHCRSRHLPLLEADYGRAPPSGSKTAFRRLQRQSANARVAMPGRTAVHWSRRADIVKTQTWVLEQVTGSLVDLERPVLVEVVDTEPADDPTVLRATTHDYATAR